MSEAGLMRLRGMGWANSSASKEGKQNCRERLRSPRICGGLSRENRDYVCPSCRGFLQAETVREKREDERQGKKCKEMKRGENI